MSNNKEEHVIGEYLDIQTKYFLKLALDLDTTTKHLLQYKKAYEDKVKECNELNERLIKTNNDFDECLKKNTKLTEELEQAKTVKPCTCKDKKKKHAEVLHIS